MNVLSVEFPLSSKFLTDKKPRLGPTMDLKRMRGIAHHLDPVVTVAESGITDGVVGEVDRALTDHELIKVRISLADRDARRSVADELCARTGATLVQRIGKVVGLYRRNPDAKPALSNLARYS